MGVNLHIGLIQAGRAVDKSTPAQPHVKGETWHLTGWNVGEAIWDRFG